MKILSKYIAQHVVVSTCMVLMVLLALYSFMDFVTELDDLGKRNYQMSNIVAYLILTMPNRLYDLLPIAALLGSVMGLGTLASQSELVVMRTSGYSIRDINQSVLVVAMGLMLFALLVGEGIRPTAEQTAREMKSVAQTGTVGIRSSHGFWTRDGTHFNHIEKIQSNGSFKKVSIYEFDEQFRLRIITKARKAEYDGEKWVLTNVVQSRIDERGVKIRSIKHAKWKTQLNPGMLNIVIVPPEYLPIWGLLDYINYLKENFQSVDEYELAFWTKIMMPISTAVMVLLAVPFIFGPLRSTPVGGRIFAGAIIGVGFHLFNQTFQQMGLVYGLSPWFAAAFPAMVFGGVTWWMNTKIR
jgi:lipopolysaccharide export system permease protein